MRSPFTEAGTQVVGPIVRRHPKASLRARVRARAREYELGSWGKVAAGFARVHIDPSEGSPEGMGRSECRCGCFHGITEVFGHRSRADDQKMVDSAMLAFQ